MDASVEKIHAVQMWAISSEEDNENSNYKVIAMKQGNKGMRHKTMRIQVNLLQSQYSLLVLLLQATAVSATADY